MAGSIAYQVHALRKIYRTPPVVANDRISFAAHSGEAFGLLGANGAGKSTLVRQLVGLLKPTAGAIELFGERLEGTRMRNIGRAVAYLPQGSLSLGEFKVAESVEWTGILRGYGKQLARSSTATLLERLAIEHLADRPLRKLSGGERRLCQIAMTLTGRLPVLIFDEPTVDIDPRLRQRVWDLIDERAREGAAVILVTHDVAEAERVLDRVAIMDAGRIVAAGTPAELKASLAHRTRVEIVIAENSSLQPDALAKDLGPDTRISGRRISAWVPADDAIRTLEKIVSTAGLDQLEDVHLVSPGLQDVYLDLGIGERDGQEK
jgi:ABC-2 type transport system ATP-binding protein